MSVVIDFSGSENPGVERNGVNFAGIVNNRQDSSKGIIRSIRLNDKRLIRSPVRENGSGGESGLESVERSTSFVGKGPGNTLAGEASERNNDAGIFGNETTVEIREA